MPFVSLATGGPAIPYAYSVAMPTANAVVTMRQALIPGIYTVTASAGSATVEFWGDAGYIGSVTAGTTGAQFNLATAATAVTAWNDTASTSVVIALAASVLASVSGTLHTYTSSAVLALSGPAHIMLVGPGGKGGNATNIAAGGGGSAAVVQFAAQLVGGETLTLSTSGASLLGRVAGAGGDAPNASGGFYGAGGVAGICSGLQPGDLGINGVAGPSGAATGTVGTAAANVPWNIFPSTGATASGASGGYTNGGGAGVAAGIGRSGNGGGSNSNGQAATGYGCGGGGAGANSGTYSGGPGSPGVCYIIQ